MLKQKIERISSVETNDCCAQAAFQSLVKKNRFGQLDTLALFSCL